MTKKKKRTKVKTFDETIIHFFSDNRVPKERSHYICIAAICIDSVLKKKKEKIILKCI